MARPGLTKHRKFLRLSRTLGNVPLALGCLELIWEKCYENGDDYLGDVLDVEAAAQWPGEPAVLCQALLAAGGDGNAGFVEELTHRTGHYRCHDLFDHAPRYVAKRLERELERQSKGVSIRQIRAEAGRKGAAATNAQRAACDSKRAANEQQVVATPAPAPAPAPNKNSSSEQETCSDQVQTPSRSKPAKGISKEASQLATLLASEIRRNKADYRITPAQERKWAVTADRMLRLDGRNCEEIADLIRWVQHNEFWMTNVLSMGTLRDKFDQLQIKRARECSGGKSNGKNAGSDDYFKKRIFTDNPATRALAQMEAN